MRTHALTFLSNSFGRLFHHVYVGLNTVTLIREALGWCLASFLLFNKTIKLSAASQTLSMLISLNQQGQPSN